jgi:hypothetical protein
MKEENVTGDSRLQLYGVFILFTNKLLTTSSIEGKFNF